MRIDGPWESGQRDRDRAAVDGAAAKAMKPKRQIAGRDYDNSETCQLCWGGGDLVCCDYCPASYHEECCGGGRFVPVYYTRC